jgi:alanyl-tRNA synthetase
LVAREEDKASLVAGVTSNLTAQIKAGDLMQHVNAQIGGKGGGRPDMAMGAATELTHLSSALESVSTWVAQKLN